MRKISYNFLLVFGMLAVFVGLGVFSAATKKVSAKADKAIGKISKMAISVNVAANKGDVLTKISKNMSAISVSTDEPMTVFVDGVEIGKTQGNQVKFEKEVTPGIHEVKVVPAEGKEFVRTYTFTKGIRQCICLKTIKEEKNCPYDIRVTGPEKVTEGDLITFAVFDAVGAGTALNYIWKVTPSNARVTSGLGTPSITVDTAGLGGQSITAEVNVGDGVYDKECSQRKSTETIVERPTPTPPITTPTPWRFDEWDARSFDDDKFRFDNLAIELQNKPDSQAYIIMYQGTNRISKGSLESGKLSKRALNYLVQRGVPPQRLQVTNWGTRVHTHYEVWIVPPGANPPVPRE